MAVWRVHVRGVYWKRLRVRDVVLVFGVRRVMHRCAEAWIEGPRQEHRRTGRQLHVVFLFKSLAFVSEAKVIVYPPHCVRSCVCLCVNDSSSNKNSKPMNNTTIMRLPSSIY